MKLSSFLAGLFLAAGVPAAVTAAETVVSNLEADGVVSAQILDSSGQPLALGCGVRLVLFPGMSAPDIQALAGSGLASILGQSQVFGASSSIGAGLMEEGRLEFQTGQPVDEPVAGLHLLVVNAVDPAAADEFLLLELPVVLPADGLTGPGAHVTIHLADAEVVFGSSSATGFATARGSLPSGYESWVSARLGGDYTEQQRLPESDPDHDGRANLIEYATGTPPDDGQMVECLKLVRTPIGETRVIYLRRTGDEGIRCRVDHGSSLEHDAWSELVSAVDTPAEVPFPAPEGCEWVGQALPAGGKGFVRLRVEMVSSND